MSGHERQPETPPADRTFRIALLVFAAIELVVIVVVVIAILSR